MKKNIALIGAGYWGKNHLRNLNELDALNCVLETSDEITRQRLADFPDIPFVKEIQPILDNPDIEGVVIAAPAHLHYSIAKECLENGKDVLVEKPLALTVAEGEELVRLAEENKRILMVGHILRYHAAVLKLQELIENNELGELRYVYSHRLNFGKLRTEEDVLWSFAPHDISLVLMVTGEKEPQTVTASGGAYINPDIGDTTVVSMTFDNGVRGHVFVSWLNPFKEQKLVVVGSKKMAVFDDVTKEKLFLYPHTVAWEGEAGNIPVAQKADAEVVPFETTQPLREELVHFIDCINTRNTPRTDGCEGLRVLKVLERAGRK